MRIKWPNTMYEARRLEAWEGEGVLAECGKCEWNRLYPKATVRQAASQVKRHYYATHGG